MTSETKAAKVKSLFSRQQGAGIDDMCAATQWKPHSVRAFLTGLRKNGYSLQREQVGDSGARYRITKCAPLSIRSKAP